ncbi:MAG: hypothetical protein GWO07_02735 [Candidatus Dadabacteria bacterium]|nr:hypothetical protein [Candidatus Dadabacteria bacterium]NIS07683.1 hypothetical protein [Candidatus Dadabacteria bacterium]NIV42262.1 hypothetical protein [Candidatus Dadabacteria bacterium]NIX14769.1 hypothetical protein [Candidatus Dadabacteria bacterium]NIY21310.1 hypothetical protein [Candidatus Dadabacteria bacterium]
MEEFKTPTNLNKSEKNILKLFSLEEYLFAFLIILSIIGIAVTSYSNKHVLKYWLVMVPVFAIVNIYYCWVYENKRGQKKTDVIKNQLLQWAGLLIAVLLVLLLVNYGNLKSSNAGYFIIILLSLGTYISGIQYDRRLTILAALLGLTAGVTSVFEHIFWIVLVLAILYSVYFIYIKRRNF